VVTPSDPIIIVTVSAQTTEGCNETTEIVIISGSLTPRKSFSPNGDGLNDWWTINNSRVLQGCTVYIFDSRGATIFEATSPFADDQVWDGNYNGKPAPEGVYYFVMKCDDSSENQTGAILLAR
jgi:gliding motility-associated-like protein